jgi:hypothetical protein
MEYILRDVNGVMKAKFSAEVAGRIMDECSGFFRQARYKDCSTPARVFEITEDFRYGTKDLKVFIWKGEVLVPEA